MKILKYIKYISILINLNPHDNLLKDVHIYYKDQKASYKNIQYDYIFVK